ncbi:MAG: hypothetical protein AAFV07_03135, partial [Bacteroidota bacterium]
QHQQLLLKGYHAQGQLTVGSAADEGTYMLRAYTRQNLNYGAGGVFGVKIPVYDLPVLNNQRPPEAPKSEKSPAAFPGGIHLDVKLDQKVAELRSPVKAMVEARDGKGNLLAGKVILRVSTAEMGTAFQHTPPPVRIMARTAEPTYQPEKRLNLSGTAYAHDRNQPLTSTSLSVYLVNRQLTIWGKSIEGEVSIELPDLYGPQTFQVFDINPFGKQTVRLAPEKITLEDLGDMSRINWQDQPEPDAAWVEWYLFQAAKRKQFAGIFDQAAVQRVVAPAPDSSTLYAPDLVFDKGAYLPFPNLEEFVKEAMVPFVKWKKSGGQRTLRLLSLDTKRRHKTAPAYLVNNYLTLEESDALNIPYADIRSISVYGQYAPLLKQFGPIGAQGVLSIQTRSGKAPDFVARQDNLFTWEGFALPQPYPVPDYARLSERIRLEQSPDLRPVLAWNGQLPVDEGVATWQWYHNDLTGPIRVEVLFMAPDGRWGWTEVFYEGVMAR